MEDAPQNYPDDEIELIDILKVIWKWKWLILGGAIICAAIVGAISYNSPKIYRVDMVLRPGVAKITESGDYIYIDDEENIRAIITAGTFSHRIVQELNKEEYIKNKKKVDNAKTGVSSIDFGVQLTNNTNTLKVSYETQYVDRGMFVLDRLNYYLAKYYEPIVKRFKQQYELSIQEEQTAITKIENQVSNLKSDIKVTRSSMKTEIDNIKNEINKLSAGMGAQKSLVENEHKRVAEIEEEIDRVAKNTNQLIDQRNTFLKQLKNNDNILSSIIYSNTIQQNISYLDKLKAQKTEALNKASEAKAAAAGYQQDIEKEKARIENVKEQKLSEIQSLKATINDAKSDQVYRSEKINELKFKKENVGNIQQLQAPIRSPGPVSPRVVFNVVLTFVIAVFIMLLVSFFAEYLLGIGRRHELEK